MPRSFSNNNSRFPAVGENRLNKRRSVAIDIPSTTQWFFDRRFHGFTQHVYTKLPEFSSTTIIDRLCPSIWATHVNNYRKNFTMYHIWAPRIEEQGFVGKINSFVDSSISRVWGFMFFFTFRQVCNIFLGYSHIFCAFTFQLRRNV